MNYYRKFVSALTAVTCMGALVSTSVAEEVKSAELSVKYEPGKSYFNTQTTNMLMNMGPGAEMNNLMVMSMVGEAKEHDKGVELAIRYEGMNLKVKVGENVVAEYDSTKEDNPEAIAKELDPLMDFKFSAIFSKEGKYIKSEGFDALAIDPNTGLTKETLESMMKQSTLMLPNRDVKVGETWKSEIKVPIQNLGKMEMSFDQKLVSIGKLDGKETARIEFTGAIKPLELNTNGVVVKVESKAITGLMLFDLDLGQIRKTDMTMELKMNAGGRDMSMTAITNQELTQVEKTK